MSSIDNIYFDVSTLKVDFNKKVDINDLFKEIARKYSLNEITKYVVACYYKWKRNLVLISFTNEKVFVHSNKRDLPVCGVYSYKDILGFEFIENNKQNEFLFKTTTEYYRLKSITKQVFNEFTTVFENEKVIFMNSKLGQNIAQSVNNFSTINYTKLEEHTYGYDGVIKKEEVENKTEEQNNSNETPSKKNKRVVNDEFFSESTTFSSAYINNLLTDKNTTLPNNKPTIIKNIDDRVSNLESTNIFDKPLDSVALKFTTNSKLNTIPVLAEFSSLTNPDKVENRLLFSRNWIEFTKHNVRNKLLGVDANGNGAYIEIDNSNKSQIIKSYKAKDYLINDIVRYGLRSSLSFPYKDSSNSIGLESMYYLPNSNEKLDIWKYDGIIFMNQKYYFNIPSEFNVSQRKMCTIHRIQKDAFDRSIVFELIFEDDTVKYNVYDKNMEILTDSSNGSSLYDLKWLTFFKD